MDKKFNDLRRWLPGPLELGLAAVLALPTLAGAQQAEEEAQQAPASAGEIEEVVVLGTVTGTGIRGVAPVGSQVFDIPRAQLLESPVRDAAEIISNLPQGSQIDSGVASADGGNDSGGSGLNLRGLGGNASLMLLDGHRMASQGVSSIGPDPSAIPFAAIERVEVVLDGASSVYGSDAVAGVVNYVMRDDFQGVDVQISGRSGVYDSTKIELVSGHNWNGGNLMWGLSFEDQDSMPSSARDYLREDLRPYGGNDNRHRTPTSGNSPIISIGSRDYAVPANFTGELDATGQFRRPTADEIRNAPLEANLADRADYVNYMAALERTGAFLRGSWDLNDAAELTYTGMWSRREASNISWNRIRVRVTENTPYWIPGLTSRSNYTVVVSMPENGIPYTADPYVTTLNNYLDLRWDIGEWQMNGSVFQGRTYGADINRPEANNAALINDPAGTPSGYRNYADYGNNPEWLNPYLTDADQPGIENLVGWTWRYADQNLTGINARFEGPLMELPGGTMRLNAGAEHSTSDHWLGLPQTVRYYNKDMYWLRDTVIDRQVNSAFAELYAPLAGDMPGVQLLALSASVRRDDYSDFGPTTNPRFGLTWDISDSLSVRASAGEAFRAPTLTQVNPGVNSTLTRATINASPDTPIPVTIPEDGETEIFSRGGRTPTLGPETAEMWSVGFDYTPIQVEGLQIQFTYYDVDYSNRIETLPNWTTALSSAQNYRIYEPYIYPYTQPANCVDGDLNTYNPILTRWLELEGTRFAGGSGDCRTVAVIDRGEQNVGSLFQRGIDYQVSYAWETGAGAFRASLNVADILELNRSLISGGEVFSILDRIGWQISRRSNARLNWANDNWSATLTARIEGSYLNDNTPTVNRVRLPSHEVGAWTTYDLMVAYTAPEGRGLLSGVNFALGAQNLTDADPPIVLNGRVAFDSNVHNPFNRSWRMELSKRFE